MAHEKRKVTEMLIFRIRTSRAVRLTHLASSDVENLGSSPSLGFNETCRLITGPGSVTGSLLPGAYGSPPTVCWRRKKVTGLVAPASTQGHP